MSERIDLAQAGIEVTTTAHLASPSLLGEYVAGLDSGDQAGDYAAAIARWERTLGRPAPNPTKPGRTGNPRLNPELVEWMMGWPAGHVTNVPGLTDAQALRIGGNGVVPQQAAAATRALLHDLAQEQAA